MQAGEHPSTKVWGPDSLLLKAEDTSVYTHGRYILAFFVTEINNNPECYLEAHPLQDALSQKQDRKLPVYQAAKTVVMKDRTVT